MLYSEKYTKKANLVGAENKGEKKEIKGANLWFVLLLCALILVFCARFYIDFLQTFSIYNDSIYIQPSGSQC
jgi:hypothetical protein